MSNGNYGILIANYRGKELEIPLEIVGIKTIDKLTVTLLDQISDLREVETKIIGNRLILRKHKYGSAAFFITFEEKQ